MQVSSEFYQVIKSLHICFMVAWFAGLFYLPRILIYQTEAYDKTDEGKRAVVEQMKIMARRLWYIITWPACILTTLFGISMLALNPALLKMPWMHVKLGFVGVLLLYQVFTHRIYAKLQNDRPSLSSQRLRLFNEIPTLLLFAIIFTVVFRSTDSWLYGVIGLVSLGVILTLGVSVYKKIRRD